MEKSHSKSSLKFVKSASQSSDSWSSSERGMTKDEVHKERNYDKANKTSQRPSAKENTKPQEIKLHTQQRAIKRAIFNYKVATRLYLIEQQKKEEERLQKLIDEEEIRLMRKEMIPRAQLMPFFDKPFFPQRSNRPLTVPREPSFGMRSSKCSSCIIPSSQLYGFQQSRHTLKAIYKGNMYIFGCQNHFYMKSN